MKRRIIGVLAIVALLSLAVAAYAYTNGSSTKTVVAASCCKKDSDSCPMKGKAGHDVKEGEHAKASCCDKHRAGHHATAEGQHNCDCCGDSCPMKKGETATAASATDGKNCCDDCDCCKGESETSA